jgi:hypothetical protein
MAAPPEEVSGDFVKTIAFILLMGGSISGRTAAKDASQLNRYKFGRLRTP